jgi:hypothetical protein
MHGRWFWAWVLVGGGAALGLTALGPLALGPTVIVGLLLATRPAARSSAFGLLTGAGLLLLYVAWVQRAGPGTTCWQTATASGCEEHLNPLPWLTAGLALTAAGFVGDARTRRAGTRGGDAAGRGSSADASSTAPS